MNTNEDNASNLEESIESINVDSEEIKIDQESIETEDKYQFGWSPYAEITNGRFAMIGFLAIILIELFSKQSFLNWAGIL